MQKLLVSLTVILFFSCSEPKEIIKSPHLQQHCYCEGEGKYTLVLDAGMGNWSLFYQPLFQKLKVNNKVCLIDRPGYNMDTVTTLPRDLVTVATELNDILIKQGILSNVILVGHSLGGLHVRMYQSMFPDKVMGLVLLDAAHSEQFTRLPMEFYDIMKNQPQQLDKVIQIAQKGYLKYGKGKIPTFGLPENLLNQYYAVATQPEYYYSMKLEVEYFEDNLKKAVALTQLNDLPLLVIGSKNSMDKTILPIKSKDYPYIEHNKIWFELQKDLSRLSSNSTFITSKENHYLNVTDPELVYAAMTNWLSKNFSYEK
ncbi:MAG: alpha/beta fold hydrolase [Cytophagaceae bacterium]